MQLFVKDLTVIDFSYLCPARGIVGESWIVDVILNGALNDESMILDFGKVKKQLKRIIDDYVDHKLVVPAENSITHIEHDAATDRVKVLFKRDGKDIFLNCPSDAYAFVYDEAVTMSSVEQYLKEIIRTELPDNVDGIHLTLRTEEIPGAFYHYSHGLKKHDGNCQRIAHGHRSAIHLFINGQRDTALEQFWAERWQDIYIGTTEDLANPDDITQDQELLAKNDSHYYFSYEAAQGQFDLIMPKSECELIVSDSTVECLAQYIGEELVQQHVGKNIEVYAFEGVGKGAIWRVQ